jgi:hypothetical protein
MSLRSWTLGIFVLGGIGSSAAACAQVLGFDRPYVEGDGGLAASSGSGGASGAGGTGGTAPAVPCATVNDCPGQDTECSTLVCTGGFCGADNAAAGTPISTQTAGNCQKLVCDGHGALTLIVDDTNVPNNGNPCTAALCTDGVPSNPPVVAGTTCGGKLTCDGQGHCTGCVGPADCPGMDNECETRSCTSGVCGYLYTASGTAVTMQTAGNCQKNVCNGVGAVSVIFDNTNIPTSTNPCVIEGCAMGSPTQSNTAAGAACTGAGTVCDGSGDCVQCLAPSTCPGTDTECQTRTCLNDTCGFLYQPSGTVVSTQTPGDCEQNVCNGTGGITAVADDADVPTNGTVCDIASCSMGMPVFTPVAEGTTCGTMKTCNSTGSCTGCTTASDCPGTNTDCQTLTCSATGVCGFSYAASGTPTSMQTAGDCKENVCNGVGGVSVIADDTDLPTAPGPCYSAVCTSGVPSTPPTAAGTACTTGGTVCNGAGVCGVCVPGTTRACCGSTSSACCGGCETCLPIGGDCCCSTVTACSSAGEWGTCL